MSHITPSWFTAPTANMPVSAPAQEKRRFPPLAEAGGVGGGRPSSARNRSPDSRSEPAHRKSQNPINCADPIEHDSSPELCKPRKPLGEFGVFAGHKKAAAMDVAAASPGSPSALHLTGLAGLQAPDRSRGRVRPYGQKRRPTVARRACVSNTLSVTRRFVPPPFSRNGLVAGAVPWPTSTSYLSSW